MSIKLTTVARRLAADLAVYVCQDVVYEVMNSGDTSKLSPSPLLFMWTRWLVEVGLNLFLYVDV
jgi:hypothetical protein